MKSIENKRTTIFFPLYILVSIVSIFSIVCYEASAQPNKISNIAIPLNINNSNNMTNIDDKSENITKEIAPLSISEITAAVGLIGLTIGLKTYKQSQLLKAKDITKDIGFPLIQEFDTDDDIKQAKVLLDGYRIPVKDKDKQIFSHFYPEGYYTYDRLNFTLRDYELTPMTLFTKDERNIRTSFDKFLDFLAKLEYLLNIDLQKRK